MIAIIRSLCLWGAFVPSVFAAPAWFFQSKDVTGLHHDAPTKKLFYGQSPQSFGLLRIPNTPEAHPVVMIIHGGCWMSNVADVSNTEPLADALNKMGYATWNIEYRSVDQAGGGYPGTFLDVAQAADYLKQIATTYHLDMKRVVVIGHSAGGQLALWVSARDKLSKHSALYQEAPLQLQGAISLGGVPDLSIARQQVVNVCGADAIGKLVGTSGNTLNSTHLAETSPIEMLPTTTQQILIYGADDLVVPEKLGQRYVDAAKEKGQAVRLERVAYAAHHEYNVPNSVVWPILLTSIGHLMQ